MFNIVSPHQCQLLKFQTGNLVNDTTKVCVLVYVYVCVLYEDQFVAC